MIHKVMLGWPPTKIAFLFTIFALASLILFSGGGMLEAQGKRPVRPPSPTISNGAAASDVRPSAPPGLVKQRPTKKSKSSDPGAGAGKKKPKTKIKKKPKIK